MFSTFRELNFFTFRVNFKQIASIFIFSVDIFLHLATFSHIESFSHLRMPHTSHIVIPPVYMDQLS